MLIEKIVIGIVFGRFWFGVFIFLVVFVIDLKLVNVYNVIIVVSVIFENVFLLILVMLSNEYGVVLYVDYVVV